MRLERELKNKLRELKKVAKNGEKVTFWGFQSGKFAAYSYAVAGADYKKLKISKLANLSKKMCLIDRQMKINHNGVAKSGEKWRKSDVLGVSKW